ncbi:hypothetical protein ASE70_02155 [Sphingomonas sp. Leaf22]|uniref:hypothetical protein n=1 Tax=Sphingomonas sp. Leaf22 TaxID=1735687 RepID=UPI0006F60267|nr:hypothetical protein [Sphingomonas sp. Leaf22]KQM90232.1 hypothetical protein ASE70_02155 [Sphingomonas sp. Leaf22]
MSVVAPPVCRRIASVTVAAVAGVAVLIASWSLREVIGHEPASAYPLTALVQISLFSIVVGSIIAVPICLLLGLPLWHFAIRSGRQRRGDALRLGLIAGGLIGAVMAIVGDPGTRWFDEPLDVLGYCLAGLCAGGVAYRLGYSRR